MGTLPHTATRAAESTGENMRKTKRSWLQIAGAIGALALCGICGNLLPGKDKDAKVAEPTAASTVEAEPITEAPPATEAPTEAPTDLPPTEEPPTAVPAPVEPTAPLPPATDPPSQTTEQQPAAPAGRIRAEAGTCPDSHPIKGNINERENTRIYHMPGSQSYRATDPEECFASEADAQAAGYRPRQ